MARCQFHSYHFIFLLMVASAECYKCNVSHPVDAVLNSVVTLTCPLTTLPDTPVIWDVLQDKKAERVGSMTNCSSSCTTGGIDNRTQKHLCRVRAVEDLQKGTGSLIISPVEKTDMLWYRCTVQNRTGSYCTEMRIVVKDEPQFPYQIKDCKNIGPLEAALNKTFMPQCPVDKSHFNASQLIWGTVEGDVTVPITRCPSGCTSSETQKPLCERAKTAMNGLLTINPMWPTDDLWFWCALSGSSTCYKFKLTVKENGSTTTQKMKAKGDSPVTQSTEEKSNGSTGNTNATLIISASAASVVLFVAMLVVVYICFQKQKNKKKNTNIVELESPYEEVENAIHCDNFNYSLVKYENESLNTFQSI